MIYCPSCGTANRDGSRFCNECGTKLPTMTSALCPTCGTPNPPHSPYCEKCGTRLIPSLTEEPEELESPASLGPKGLSLPTKSTAAEAGPEASKSPEPEKPAERITPDEEVSDWMQVVQSSASDTSDLDLAGPAESTEAGGQAAEEVPAWLSDLGLDTQPAESRQPSADELLPEWAQRLRATPEAAQPPSTEDEVPDWLKTLGSTGHLPSTDEPSLTEPAPGEETPPWMSTAGAPASEEDEDLPEWLKETPAPDFSITPAAVEPPAEEMPDWLRDLRPVAGSEEALPDWLDELGVEEEAHPESTALPPSDSALDWLSQLGATASETPLDQTPSATAETPAWLQNLGEEADQAESAVTPDWMSSLRAAAPEVDSQPTEEIPSWLSSLEGTPTEREFPAAETSDWMSSFRAAEPQEPAGQEDVPDWVRGFGAVAAGAEAADALEEEQPPEPAAEKPATDWLSALRRATPEMEAEQAAEESIPDWMGAESEVSSQAIGGPQAYEQEVPEWLRATGLTLEAPETTPPATPETPSEEEGVPDWMKGLGLAATGAAAAAAFEEEHPQESVPEEKPVTDWLSALRQATPEIEAEQASEESVPDWMREEPEAAPQAIGGPQAYEQDIPDWLRETGVVTSPPAAATEEEVPEWLREASASGETAEEPPVAQAEEEGVPDWMKGFGAAAAGAAALGAFKPEEPSEAAVPEKPATDWLSALRQATPEIEAEQASEESVPDWMREEPEASPQAIGGPQAYEQDIPDWLREEIAPVAPAEREEDEGTPAWLKGLGVAAVGAGAVAAARPEEPSDEGLPDWLREAEPAPQLTYEPPEEEVTPGETPEWLQELSPTAAGATLVAAEPEVEELEEAAEPEAEEPESVSKAATIAAAGLAAAAVAGAVGRSETAEAAPAEIPEWLKEIRQEQQLSRTAIPVPPSEATGLTQAEIPAWLEALRPREEAEAPQEVETPLETEGPFAGIAGVLPPAPMMGRMQGQPATLQFAVSAEDQARAGVLKELLAQHAVAPATIEQFVVKGSAIRRRSMRWLVTFLLIIALAIPFLVDLNALAGVPLLPKMTDKTVPLPATVQLAAYEISQLAQLPAQSKVLVVFDYDALQAGEMNRVARAMLQSPALRQSEILVASLNPQGTTLAQTVMSSMPDLQVVNLGFTPGQVNGVQSLLAKAGDVKLIIDLAASPDTVRWWAEQLKASQSAIPLVAGVSAGAEPLTMPYVQSGQVKGLVSGFPGAVAYLKATGQANTFSQNQINDYQVPLDGLALANYVLVVLIVIGLIAALLRGPRRRSA